jgi:mycothiol synthase
LTGPADWQVEPPYGSALAALIDACVAADHVSPLSGHVREAAAQPSSSEYLLALDGTTLAGLAVLPGGDPAELAVAPDHRHRGLGTQLVTAVLARTASVWAHGDLPAARALASRLELRRVRELIQMRASLSPDLPPVVLPDGVRIRSFVAGQDEDAVLGVNARAFAWHPEQGRLDRAGLAHEMQQPWYDPAGFFLAVDASDRILGFHWTKVHPTDQTPAGESAGPIGEIYVLGVDPESPVRRLGAPLSVVGLEYLKQRGLADAMLYVEAENVAAVRLYERLGFSRYLTDVVYQR